MPIKTISSNEKTMERTAAQQGVPGLDYAVECQSKEDFCELLPAAASLRVCMGDVAGGDAAAAMLTASIQGWVKGHASNHESVSSTIRDLNRDVLNMSPGQLYASLFHANIHAERGEVEYVNAGYHHVLLYRRHARKAIVLDRTGTVVGLSAKSRFEQRTVRVYGGDVLVALTDGSAETMDEPVLLELLRKHSEESSRKLTERLLRAVNENRPSVLVVRFLEIGRKMLAFAA